MSVRAMSDDVESIGKIEKTKNKIFQNFQIFTPFGSLGVQFGSQLAPKVTPNSSFS